MFEHWQSRTGGLLLLLALILACFAAFPLPDAPAQAWTAQEAVPPDLSPWRLQDEGALRINSADAEELTALPGIGGTLANQILLERNLHGPFFYPEDLLAVKGIGTEKLKRIRDLISFRNDGD